MVEIRVFPEGYSTYKKITKKSGKAGVKARSKSVIVNHSGTSQTIGSNPNYHREANKTVSRMQAENALEHKRVRPRDVRRIIKRQLLAGNPFITEEEINLKIEELLPKLMEEYKGSPAIVHTKSPTGRDLYEKERRRIVANNSHRRREDQILSPTLRRHVGLPEKRETTEKLFESEKDRIDFLKRTRRGIFG